VLLDRHGEVIQELRSDPSARRLEWVPLGDVSPALRRAIVFAEDRRFYRHHGVDWISLAAALPSGLRLAGLRGASTITMQLAARLDEDIRPKRHRRSMLEKIRQMRGAFELERRWSKDQILEAYLNLVTFRGELEGVDAASRGLFRKDPQGLDESESLILAALVRSPNAEPGRVAVRACSLNDALGLGLEESNLTSFAHQALSAPYFIRPRAGLAPHVALRLARSRKRNGGQTRVIATIDADLEWFATEALRRHLLTLRAQNVHDGALLAAENSSGDVLAYVGNLGEFASARFVDGVEARRQAGSTLKPFLYGLAFEKRLLTPASLIEDSPLEIPIEGGVYRPRNYDRMFRGITTARIALASSLNVPAVRTLGLVGVDPFVDALERFGFEQLRAADYYGPSLALGAADITLWDLVNAYRCLANGGLCSALRLTPGEARREPVRVLSQGAAFLVSDILSDRESRSATFNLESPLSTRFWTSVKTGTSKDMRDNWCVGYSDRYTVGVWVGNFAGDPMWNVSGISGAAPVWVDVMNWLHRDRTSRAPSAPAGVVAQDVAIAALGQSRREWFLPGTETALVRDGAGQGDCRITYPAAGTVVALDPDIPAEQQKILFEAETDGRRLRWLLDGRIAGAADSVVLWPPAHGSHTLALLDESDRVIDSVAFEVRGSPGP
jgi:penicillin-binding protein 1C